MTEDKEMNDIDRRLELAMQQLDRQFKQKNTVMRLDADPEPVPSISTNSYSLDLALGIGGLPRGRIVEVYGPESSGKSTLCLSVIANAQKAGGRCLFVDAEYAVDPTYAKALGVDIPGLYFSQPSTGEEALEIVAKMVATGGIDVAVIDSVAALVPKAELEGDIGDAHVGRLPRLMSQAMRMLTGEVHKSNTLVIFTNQIREKVGVMFGNPETTPGGRALKFHSSVRIDLRKREDLKDKEGRTIGSRVESKIVKNKVGPPLRKAEWRIIYGRGIDYLDSMIESAVDFGIFTKHGGGWIKYEGESIGQGNDAVKEYLASDMEWTRKVQKEIEERARGV